MQTVIGVTMIIVYVLLFVSSIVVSNLAVAYFGEVSLPYVEFIGIAFVLTSRDKLHEYWKNNGLWWKMFGLIFVGCVTSYLMNRGALNIAIASCAAFLCAGLVDTLVYQNIKAGWFLKSNGSNLISALTDSVVFTFIALGGVFLPGIILQQFVVKVAGGVFWSLVLFLGKHK